MQGEKENTLNVTARLKPIKESNFQACSWDWSWKS